MTSLSISNTPAVSIIIPNYNQEQYIGDCIRSIKEQTYTDYEVLIIDDGSTDHSIDAMRQTIDHDERFTIIPQQNQGVAVARNTGLQHAQGTWICFIDPDDSIAPAYLQTLLKVTDTYPNADVIMSSCIAFNNVAKTKQHFFSHDFVAHTDSEKVPLYHQLLDGSYQQPEGFVTAIGVPWGKLYNHVFLAEHELQFDPDLPRMQDNIFNMQVFHEAHEIVYIDYAGYEYRMGGLTARTYKNTAAKLYHPAIDARSKLMHQYDLVVDPELYNAWNEEQINLYFQEIKAVALLAPHQLSAIRKAVRRRVHDLQHRIQKIDVHALSRAGTLKRSMLRGSITLDGIIPIWYRQQSQAS